MEFMPEADPAVAESFIENFLHVYGPECGCQPVMRIGAMAAIHPMGQALLKAATERGVRVELSP